MLVAVEVSKEHAIKTLLKDQNGAKRMRLKPPVDED